MCKSNSFDMKQDNSNKPFGISVHDYKIKVSGITKKIIYHFSDVHLTEHDDLSDEHETLSAIKKTQHWEKLRLDFANCYNESYTAGQEQSAHNHFLDLLSVAEKGDALVIAGDLSDYTNGANLRMVSRHLNNLAIPYMYVCGNHEHPSEMPNESVFLQVKKPVQTLDLGDMIIFGIDNSKREITAEQNEQLKSALLTGKPILIVMHIPIMTDENRIELEKCGEYFQLNHKNASKEVFEFIDLIKANSDKIIAVLAGHLHFMNNSEITSCVMQYVSSQGILGNINRYEIG